MGPRALGLTVGLAVETVFAVQRQKGSIPSTVLRLSCPSAWWATGFQCSWPPRRPDECRNSLSTVSHEPRKSWSKP